MPPKTKDDPKSLILQLLRDKNRPYSINTLGDELHGEYAKSVVTKAVDALTSEGKITCKLFGKTTKLYFARQDGLPVASADELAAMDARLEEMRQAEADRRQRLEELRQRRNRLLAVKPMPELGAYRDQLRERAAAEEARRDELVRAAEGITPEDAEKNQKNFRTRCEQWRVRRNKCMEIIDTLCEASEKKPAQVIAELDLETDEANKLRLEFRDKQYKVVEM